MGKRVGEWVYELFITTLDAEGFLVEDVLDLSHGRGADRGRCWPMKTSKKIPIAGVPTPSVGKSCGISGPDYHWCGTCASRLQTDDAGRPGTRDRVGPSQRSSGGLRR